MDITVNKLPDNDPTYLFHRYPSQAGPQPCHVVIDLEDGTLTCEYNVEIGGEVPVAVGHRRTIWIPIPVLPADTANRLLDEITRLAGQVVDGATIEWDGNNHVGRLNDTAADALAQIEAYIADACPVDGSDPDLLVQEYEAHTWFDDDLHTSADLIGLTADTPDADMPAIAAALRTLLQKAHTPHIAVTGAVDAVNDARDTLREHQRAQLEDTVEKIDLLLTQRDKLIRQIHAWGVSSDTLRSLGALADLSHSRIDQIIKTGAASDTTPDWEYRIQQRQADGTFDNEDTGSDTLGEALDICDHLNAGVPRHMNWRWYRVVDRDGTVRTRQAD